MASVRVDEVCSQTPARHLLIELQNLLERNPPIIPSKQERYDCGIDEDYKDVWQQSNGSKKNRLSIVPILLSAISTGMERNKGSTHRVELRICSVGCGDGIQDNLFVRNFMKKFPKLGINYTGLDILEAFCSEARSKMSEIQDEHFQSLVLCRDFERNGVSDLPKFDIVNCIHMIYYVTDLVHVVNKILSMVKPGGMAIIGVVSDEGLSDLRKILWKHEGRHDFWTSTDVMRVLDEKGLKYRKEQFTGIQDFSQCVEDNFKSPRSRAVLDFACHTKMKWYCEEAVALCMEYVKELADNGNNNYVLNHGVDIIVADM